MSASSAICIGEASSDPHNTGREAMGTPKMMMTNKIGVLRRMMDPKRTVNSKRPMTDAGTEPDIFGMVTEQE